MVWGYTTLAPSITLSLLLIVRMILHATAILQASVKKIERVKATIVNSWLLLLPPDEFICATHDIWIPAYESYEFPVI
ncbi:unnamed protein product [Blepharisma stoltei]|uniref:Secreted protein n=1 Tax=Blepharisma stoltei TaxID=1481888 RepID=A0AAU9J4R9_9CILI|nr:unnamed protein product [Blepharisma stoltei]